MDEAGRAIDAAQIELQRYHDGATAAMKAIAAGKIDATPFVSSVRRLIKYTESNIQSLSLRLPRAQDQLDAAQKLIVRALEDSKPDAPEHALLVEAQRTVEQAAANLAKFNSYAADLTTLLRTVRSDYLPECASTPPKAGSNDGHVRLGD